MRVVPAYGDPTLVADWNRSWADLAANEARWITWLRAYGVKAAHPDDGWVNRDKKFHVVRFAYPRFDDGVEVGDLICLGDPTGFRMVKVRQVIEDCVCDRPMYEVF